MSVHGGGISSARSYVTAQTNFTQDTKRSTIELAKPQPPPLPSFVRIMGCIECYKPGREVLEYDYTYDDVNGKKPPQGYPRIRERGEYYIDSFNPEPWSCSFGTAEKVGFTLTAHVHDWCALPENLDNSNNGRFWNPLCPYRI